MAKNSRFTQALEEGASEKVMFCLDSRTLLFQTHESEDVSVLQDRVSLIEIHEFLMEVNLGLIPPVKIIQKAFLWSIMTLLITLVLALLMILLNDIRFLTPILFSFAFTVLCILVTMVVRKKIFDKVINKVIAIKREFYISKGLYWKLKNYIFPLRNKGLYCWLELHDQGAVETEMCEKGIDHHVVTFAKVQESHRNQELNSQRKSKTAFNFTLGASKNMSTRKTINYATIDMKAIESTRVRKPSL